MISKTLKERFEKFIIPITETGCWIWMGASSPQGYGRFETAKDSQVGKQRLAHRISYGLYKGPIPEGHDVCHTCDNPSCVNPDHLFTGTRNDNIQDAVKKGRMSHGERHYRTKLTGQDVLAIRSDNRAQRIVAKDYGVHQNTISRIKRGESWCRII